MTITPGQDTAKGRRRLVDWNLGDGDGPPPGAGADAPAKDDRRPERRSSRLRRQKATGPDRAGPAPVEPRPADSANGAPPGPPAGGGAASAGGAPPGPSGSRGTGRRATVDVTSAGSWGPPASPASPAVDGPASPAVDGPASLEVDPAPALGASPAVPAGGASTAGAAPAVDPRMRRRRAEVVRATEWRRLRIGGSIAAVVVLVVGLFGLAHTGLIAARRIRVTGAPAGKVNRLLTSAGLEVGQPMIDVRPARVAADLRQVPWVASVSVRRVWPTTVDVTVRVRRPVAQVPTGPSLSGPVVEIDVTGRAIARLATPRASLPILLGVGSAPAVGEWLARSTGAGWPLGSAATRPVTVAAALDGAAGAVSGALAMAAGLPASGASHGIGGSSTRLGRIEVAADATISAELTPGPVTVFFGTPTALAAKVTALVSMLHSQTLATGSLLDLQVPDRPTLTGTASPLTP